MHKLKKAIHADINRAMSGMLSAAAEVRKCETVPLAYSALTRLRGFEKMHKEASDDLRLVLLAENFGKLKESEKETKE
jgi:hypothetical protein